MTRPAHYDDPVHKWCNHDIVECSWRVGIDLFTAKRSYHYQYPLSCQAHMRIPHYALRSLHVIFMDVSSDTILSDYWECWLFKYRGVHIVIICRWCLWAWPTPDMNKHEFAWSLLLNCVFCSAKIGNNISQSQQQHTKPE